MSNKAKNILVGTVTLATVITPITSLAYNVEGESSINSSNTENLESREMRTTGTATATGDINLRETASWSGKVIKVVKKGETVNIISTSGEFVKAQHGDKTGYLPVSHLKLAESNNKKVTESVNLRETASWSGNIIHVVKAGETVNVLSTSGDFSKVQHAGKTGFIPTEYISGNGGGTTNPPTESNNKKVTENVNLRETASWSGNIIHVVKSGETVNVLSTSGDFSKVQHAGKTGFIPTEYISGNGGGTTTPPESNVDIESMNKTGKVINLASGDTLNVRGGTNSSTTLLGKLSSGATVKITGKDKITGWYRIDFNGKTGYVSDYYIQLVQEQTSTYKKTTANLNMRTGPSTSNSVITKIPEGTVVKVLSSSNGWDYVEYNGQKGYCSDDYLVSTNEKPTVKKITTANVNFRKGPGTNHDIIKKLDINTVVETLSTSGEWDKVNVNGTIGYINNSYLKVYNGEESGGGSNPSYGKVSIVIDPGHGGHDSGAVGFGRKEKDLALQISQKVNARLKTLGFKTIMTRNTDVYIPLSERYSIANRNNADAFVSIHLNAATPSAYGIETLYKNSKTFASNIQTEMINASGARDRGLKLRNDLAVLNGTKMPASLVETGFISNSSESSKLASSSYQTTLANAIAKGIAKYTDSSILK